MKIKIESKEHVEKLVTQFYAKVVVDQKIGAFFGHVDFEKHMPQMIHFWTFVLLDDPGYKTDVTKVHQHMRLKKEHFDRWIELFNETTDELFIGEKAQMAKDRAALVRWTIESKMNAGQ